MLEALSTGFRNVRLRLQGQTQISEEQIDGALRDIRVSLLEGDVDFAVVGSFVERVREKAVGQVVQLRAKTKRQEILQVTPADHFVKICYDELVSLMGPVDLELEYANKGPTAIMMVGLQGSGKTTTAGKLARYLKTKKGKRPMLVAADVYRPAAVQQLMVLGRKLDIPVFSLKGLKPVDLCRMAMQQAASVGRDVVILDTAGRLAVDDEMMAELEAVQSATQPKNVLFVCDAMIGQDAVRTAKSFHDRLKLTGFVLTKLDGDARGGAALSIKEVTGVPVKYVGMGEALDRLEEFRPEGLASRILGMGDIVGLMKDFEDVVDQEKAEKEAEKLLQGDFNFDDFLEQLRMVQKMGPLQEVFEKMPFIGDMLPQGWKVDEREIVRIEAMVNSMTAAERRNPDLVNDSRIERIGRGSGHGKKDVKGLLERFTMARVMMKEMGRATGMMARIPGLREAAGLRRLKRQGVSMDPAMLSSLQNLAASAGDAGGGGLGGLGLPGMEGPRRKLGDPSKRKAARKAARAQRKKNRRR
jgi:signal recognition particle subunit SRP54